MSLDDRIRQSLEDRAARAEVSDDAWAEISARTGRRRRPRLALAALGVLPALVATYVVAGLLIGDGDPESGSGVRTVAGPASDGGGDRPDSTIPAYDHNQPGTLEKAGPGEVVAVSLDGSALIVSDFDGRVDETGCEGMVEPILLRAPFEGGRREPVGFGPEGDPLSGSVVRGPDGQVAIVDVCEGFLGRIIVGHENPDGTFGDLAEFDHPLPGEAFVTGWSASGDELLAIAWVQDGETRRAAVRVDVTTGEMTEIVRGELHDVGELWDGSIVVAEDGGTIRAMDLRGGRQWGVPGELFAISPDRKTVAVVHADSIELLPAGGESRPIAHLGAYERVSYMDWSTSGETLAYLVEPSDTTANPVEGDVYVITPGAEPVRVTPESARYGGAVFSPRGDLLAFTRYRFDPDFSAEALLTRFPVRKP